MTNKKGASIKWLLNKMVFSFALAIFGSWGLMVFHLEEIEALNNLIEGNDMYAFYIDMVLRTLTFLGFFMSVYYYVMLRPRLKRVAELVGDRW
ncbi:hypothetical protein C4J81_07375 [Deltaproteobacteria bacterium Smac51]|nr:hypothetical protein C4J81_07375 [Deltaproteobacteria bacterium Smac51]